MEVATGGMNDDDGLRRPEGMDDELWNQIQAQPEEQRRELIKQWYELHPETKKYEGIWARFVNQNGVRGIMAEWRNLKMPFYDKPEELAIVNAEKWLRKQADREKLGTGEKKAIGDFIVKVQTTMDLILVDHPEAFKYHDHLGIELMELYNKLH